MQSYIKISLMLCICGVFKEFRPGEPYIVPYMTSPPLNFTSEQINHDIFPVSTYSTMASLIVVFFITDFLRYKIIIVLHTVCMIIAFLLLIFGRGVFQIKVEETFYGFHMAGEVAYFTYIYAKVDKAHFQEVTSHVRSAYLVGKCLCGVIAQLIVYYDLVSLQALLWLTIGSQVLALIWELLLPSVDRSMYFHRQLPGKQNNSTIDAVNHTVTQLIWHDLRTAYSNLYVVRWMVWWALATCCYYMVMAYSQVLWQTVRAEAHASDVQYNGAVETISTLLGAVGSLVVGRVKADWKLYGEPLLALCSLIIAWLLYVMSQTLSEFVAYLTFIVFIMIFQTMITVANSEVAKHINRESYGLIFGITAFIVYVVRSIFTYIALQIYRLEIRIQFEVYAVYFGLLGLFFFIVVVLHIIKSKCS